MIWPFPSSLQAEVIYTDQTRYAAISTVLGIPSL